MMTGTDKDLLLEELPAAIIVAYDNVIRKKDSSALILCLGDWVLREITKETTATGLTGNLMAIDTAITDEDQAFLLLTSLPSSYDNLKMTEAKGDGGEGLYVRRRSGQRDMEQGFCNEADGYDNANVMMAMSVEELLDCIMDSGGSYHITYRRGLYHMTYLRDYLVNFGEYDGDNILLCDGRECRVWETGGFYHEDPVGQDQGYKEFTGGMGSVQVLQGVEFEVETQEDHTFEVEPHGNLLVRCSKWKAGLKDDMDARSDVYVLSDGCKKCSDDSDVYYWEYTPGIVIVKDQSGNTPRVSRSRSYNGKLVQTLSEGHSILSLKGSLSGDYDVEKNGKWSCIYAIGSQEYQKVCTRLDIALADVGMLDKFDRGLQTDVQAAKEAITLKRLAIESGFELKIVAGIATGALSKAIPGLRFQHRLKLLRIKDF
ncbi:hypothetical protein Tco_0398043 [Tanacetum coccineum]